MDEKRNNADIIIITFQTSTNFEYLKFLVMKYPVSV